MSTSLPTTRLGWTGMHLTRVGFGALFTVLQEWSRPQARKITGTRWQPLTLMASSVGRTRLASQPPGTAGFPGAICIKEDQ